MITNFILHDETNEQEMEEELLGCLQRRRLGIKFLYWGPREAAQWLTVCQDKNYLHLHKELEVLQASIADVCRRLHAAPDRHYNILSLGISDGRKDTILLQEFSRYKKFDYFPFDIGSEMIRQSAAHLPVINSVEAYLMDFKKLPGLADDIRDSHFQQHCICFLGNTLGSVPHIGIVDTLKQSMRAGDFLLLGVVLKKEQGTKAALANIEKILEMYSTPAFQTFAFIPLERVGFSASEGMIEVEFGPNKFFPAVDTIEVFFTLGRDKSITYHHRDLHFQKGERLSLYRSYFYPEEVLTGMLQSHGLHVETTYYSHDKTVALYLCSMGEPAILS